MLQPNGVMIHVYICEVLLAKTSWPQCIIYLASWIGQEGFNPYPHYQLFQEIRWYIFAVMHGLPFLKIFAQLTSKISFFQYQIIYDLEKLLEIYLPHWQFYLSLAILKIAFDNTELAVSIIFHSITGAGCWNLVLRKTRTCFIHPSHYYHCHWGLGCAALLPCSVQNFKMIEQLKQKLWTEISQDLTTYDEFQRYILYRSLTNPTMHRQKSHNAPFWNRNVPISVTKWCIVEYGTGALWDFATGLSKQPPGLNGLTLKQLGNFFFFIWLYFMFFFCCFFHSKCNIFHETGQMQCILDQHCGYW